MVKIKLFAIVVISLLLFGCSNRLEVHQTIPESPAEFSPTKISLGGEVINLELAKTPAEREQGLSGRPFLSTNQGMLFIFPESGRPGFWMKDMNFPLDIVWLQSRRIVDLTVEIQPPVGQNEPLKIYRPQVDVNRVLEIPSGTIERLGLKIGDEVDYLD
jgi:uncharacterized membrane protein (UPF0127 family)